MSVTGISNQSYSKYKCLGKFGFNLEIRLNGSNKLEDKNTSSFLHGNSFLLNARLSILSLDAFISLKWGGVTNMLTYHTGKKLNW